MSNVTTITGGAPTPERAGQLAEDIKALCYSVGVGLSLAAIIGCLEIVKLELLDESK